MIKCSKKSIVHTTLYTYKIEKMLKPQNQLTKYFNNDIKYEMDVSRISPHNLGFRNNN